MDDFFVDGLSAETKGKYIELIRDIDSLGSVAVALSGGVDSSLLAKICHDRLGNQAIAATIVSPMLAKRELEDACKVATLVGIRHFLIHEIDIVPEVRKNPVNRCYFCKKIEFGRIIDEAKKRHIAYVLDGSNMDDKDDYRPGSQAVKELEVQSPLQKAGFTKQEIRALSRMLGLPTSDKPAYACLASRIPYAEEITVEKLSRIDKAEAYLQTLGFDGLRVRSHENIARIEVRPEQRHCFFDTGMMDAISKQLKSFGFVFVCLELEGYSMGNLNKEISINGQ